MNNVNLTGRIGQEPKIHTFENGEKQSSFSIAVNNGYYSKEKNEWIDRTIWVNVVKRGETKLKKGDLVGITGKLNVREYEKDGKKMTFTEIVAHQTELLNRKDQPTTTGSEQGTYKVAESDPGADAPDELPF